MTKIILLLAGGAIGALTRYAVSGLSHKYFEGTFPLGTLVVNLTGSLIIGLLWGLLEAENISSSIIPVLQEAHRPHLVFISEKCQLD